MKSVALVMKQKTVVMKGVHSFAGLSRRQ